FEPFSQADTSLERSRGGLGLGLALVKGLVELHGGEVWASSEGPGRGTELTVCLPEVSTPEAVGLPSSEPARQPHPRRSLVIEDNVDAAESLKEALELSGHAVSVAHSGSEGLARARELSPEVILCDIGLPGMDGYEVARALRADPALRSVGLVALTGYASPDDQRRAREAGFQLHLAKPPDLDVLERVVDELGGLREDDAQRHLLAGEEAGEGGRVPGRFDDEVVLVEAHAPQAGAAPVGAEYE
ncbi:MAG TPA: response regulator, partial [Myxococcaceae bacterium]|nr:response regulator [Myxococcaceae bacterium]